MNGRGTASASTHAPVMVAEMLSALMEEVEKTPVA